MKNLQDIFPEIDQHCEEGSQVEHDIEEDGRFPHAKEGLEENEMSGTADRQKFRYPLNDSEKNGLADINREAPPIILNNMRC